MALQKQTISLNLGQSISQENDQKVADQDTFEYAQNVRRDRLRRITKRYGTEQLPTDVVTTFTNPLSIGTSPIASSVHEHGDQLLLQNKGGLYSYIDDEGAWSFKGNYYPLTARTETVVATSEFLARPNLGRFNGYSIYVYVERVGIAGGALKVRTIDDSTGNPLRPDQTIAITNPLDIDEEITCPQVLVFSNSVFITWASNDSTGTTGQVMLASFNPISGAVGTPTVITNAGAFYRPLQGPGSGGCGIDWVVCNKTGVGERAFLAFKNTSNAVSVLAITNTGAIDGSIGTYVGASLPDRGFGIFYSANTQNLYVGYQITNAEVAILSFTSSGITQVFAGPVVTTAPLGVFFRNFTFADHPIDATKVCMFFDAFDPVAYASGTAYKDSLYRQDLTASALSGSVFLFMRGLSLAAKAVKDTLRQTIYLPCQQLSPLQGTLYVLDVFRGHANGTGYVQSKTDYGGNEGASPAFLPDVLRNDDVLEFMSRTRTRISGVQAAFNFVNNSPTNPVFKSGIAKTMIDLSPRYSPSDAFLAGSLHFPGGYLGMYDGASYGEHGFFNHPEFIQVSTSSSTSRLAVAVVTQGDGSNPEKSTVSFFNGALYLGLEGPSNYFQFQGSIATSVRVGLRVNGFGTAPTGGTQNILVDILSSDTPQEIAIKVTTALNVFGAAGGYTATTVNGGIVTITNTANGAATDISMTGFTSAAALASGPRSAAIIWSWVDNNGFQHRSAPVIQANIASTGYPLGIVAYCPPITNRDITTLRAELYMTQAGSTTFHYAGEGFGQATWSFTGAAVAFLYSNTDALLASNELLYTTGGILANSSIPACTAVSTFKNRLVVCGVNPNEVYYSKTALNGLPVEVADELFLTTGNDDDAVQGARQLDDKLIIGKTGRIIAYAGDGANDLGEGVTFSQPISVASDVGVVNQKSMVVFPEGLWFNSLMGINLVTRGLQVIYPGNAVKDFNDHTVMAGVVLKDDQQTREVRFILDGGESSLVYDYNADKWAEFTHYEGTGACLWRGSFVRCDYDGLVYVEIPNQWIDTAPDPADNVSYHPSFTTQWLKLNNVQDYQRIWRLMLLGVLKSKHTLNFKVYYDYDETAFDSYTFDSTQISDGVGQDASVYQPEIHLKRQKCDSIKISVTAVPASPAGTEECLTMTDMAFLVGMKQGLNKVSARKKL